MTDKHFSHFDLAGFSYYDGVLVFNKLRIGDLLHLVAEPSNPHDPYAVELYYNDTKLGYIPRAYNQGIAKLLNLGHTNLFEARINRISPDAYPEKQIGVVVWVKTVKP